MLKSYSVYYNETRTHLGLGKDTPLPRPVQRSGAIVAVQSCPDCTTATHGYDFREGQRLTHWLIFFSILVLSATGYYIGHPFIIVSGVATERFVMGAMRAVHMYAAIIFILAMLVRFYWLFVGNSYARLTESDSLVFASPA